VAAGGSRKAARQLTFLTAGSGSIKPYPSNKICVFRRLTLPQTPDAGKPCFAREPGSRGKAQQFAPLLPTHHFAPSCREPPPTPHTIGFTQSLTCRSTSQCPDRLNPVAAPPPVEKWRPSPNLGQIGCCLQALCFGDFHLGSQMKVTRLPAGTGGLLQSAPPSTNSTTKPTAPTKPSPKPNTTPTPPPPPPP
jgi:hypothetical protein